MVVAAADDGEQGIDGSEGGVGEIEVGEEGEVSKVRDGVDLRNQQKEEEGKVSIASSRSSLLWLASSPNLRRRNR